MRVWPAFVNTFLRCVICAPLTPVILLLMLSIIGIPVAVGLWLLVGAWVTKPIRRHPLFNVEGDAE